MADDPARPVLVVLNDLMFRSRIAQVTDRLGLPLRAAKSDAQLERHLAASSPAMVIVDLECDSIDAPSAIRRVRALPGGGATPIIAYAGHTNANAIGAGRQAGAQVVLARSAFIAQLPQLLERVASSERARSGPVAEAP